MELRVDPMGNNEFDASAWANPQFLFPDQATAEASVSGRPKVIFPPNARRIDLLKLVDLQHDKIGGTWEKRDETFVATRDKPVPRIEFPYVSPAEYDVRLEFVPLWCDTVAVVCAAENRQFRASVGGWGNTIAGFDILDGKPAADTESAGRSASGWLIIGHKHELVVRIRKKGAELYLDGRPISHVDGGFSRASLPDAFSLHRKDTIGIGVEIPVEIYAAEVFEVTGTGTILREAP